MKTLLLFLALLVPMALSADEAPVIIRISPGVFSITEKDHGTIVKVLDGWAPVSMEITNTGLETILWGNHGQTSGGVVGQCTLDFFYGLTTPICGEFESAMVEFYILPGETTYIPIIHLYASDWVEPGFSWQQDIFFFTNTGMTFQSSFTGLVYQPDPAIYTTETPEPLTMLLMLTGLAGLGVKLRRAK